MSTTFKVGDRVKLTGKAWAENYPAMHLKAVEVIGFNLDGNPTFVLGGGLWAIHTDTKDWSATLVEPAAPAPDTRKRLRDITDLADGDVVDIAGVEITYSHTPDTDGPVLLFGDRSLSVSDCPFADMLVDELRRKPRTEVHRIYREVPPSEAKIGDLVTQEALMGAAYRWSGDREKLKGCRVWRFVDETEVPR